jgi:hypothetical protein
LGFSNWPVIYTSSTRPHQSSTDGNPVFWFLLLVFCIFLVFSLVWFENKLPSFAHLDGKDEIFLRADVFYALLFMKEFIEKYM